MIQYCVNSKVESATENTLFYICTWWSENHLRSHRIDTATKFVFGFICQFRISVRRNIAYWNFVCLSLWSDCCRCVYAMGKASGNEFKKSIAIKSIYFFFWVDIWNKWHKNLPLKQKKTRLFTSISRENAKQISTSIRFSIVCPKSHWYFLPIHRCAWSWDTKATKYQPKSRETTISISICKYLQRFQIDDDVLKVQYDRKKTNIRKVASFCHRKKLCTFLLFLALKTLWQMTIDGYEIVCVVYISFEQQVSSSTFDQIL